MSIVSRARPEGLAGRAGADDCRSRPGAELRQGPARDHVLLPPAALGSERRDLRVAVSLRPGLAGAALRPREGLEDGGNLALHVHDDRHRVLERRIALQRVLGLDAVQWLAQVHGDQVQAASGFHSEREPEVDGALSDRPRAAVAVLTADCLPVVLWIEAPDRPAAVVHAGWQGLALGILGVAVRMLRDGHTERLPIRAWIGPSICAAHYEVEASLLNRFAQPRSAPSPRLRTKRQFSLAGTAERQLLDLGVARVTRSGWCSYGMPVFYSHRRAQHERQPGTGRMATLAWRL